MALNLNGGGGGINVQSTKPRPPSPGAGYTWDPNTQSWQMPSISTNDGTIPTPGPGAQSRPGYIWNGSTGTWDKADPNDPTKAAEPPGRPGPDYYWNNSLKKWVQSDAFGKPAAPTKQPQANRYDPNTDLGIPSNSENLYNSGIGNKLNPYITPTDSSSVYGYISGKMSDPSHVAGVASDMNAAFGKPSASSGVLKYGTDTLTQPSESQKYLSGDSFLNNPTQSTRTNQGLQGYFGSGTNTQDLLNHNVLGGPTASEEAYLRLSGQLSGKTTADAKGYLQEGKDRLAGPGYLNQASPELQGYYRGANDVQQFSDRNMGQLETPGTFEGFANSALAGDNPYLLRQREQGLAALNQQMAKRGHFNSGGAMSAIGNYVAANDAERFKYLGDMLQGAEGMGLQRLGQGQGLAQASSGEKMGQGSALQGLATGREGEYLGRADRTDALNQKNIETQQAIAALEGQLAGQSTTGFLGRQNALTQLGQAADTSNFNQHQLAVTSGTAADNAEQGRSNLRSTAANNVDRHAVDVVQALGTVGANVDQNEINRFQQKIQAGQHLDSFDIQRMGQLISSGSASDSAKMSAVGQLIQLAGQGDSQRIARIAQMWAQEFGRDSLIGNMIMQMYGGGAAAAGAADSDANSALANYFALLGQGQNAQAALPFQIGNLAINGYKAANGAKT